MENFNSYYIDEFIIEKSVSQGVSSSMLKNYRTVFRMLLEDINIIACDLSTYTTKSFKKFLGDKLIERKWTSSTYNTYRKCLKCFCNYLVSEEYLEVNPIDKVAKRREPRPLPKTLTMTQVSELVNILEDVFDSTMFYGYRNIMIVHTFLHTGLRLSELIHLQMDHVRLVDGYIKVIEGKGGKDRIIPIGKEITKILHQYLKVRRKAMRSNDGYLFPTVNGNALGTRDLTKMIVRIRRGITFHFTWHQLRHTYATELNRRNFGIYDISKVLGHGSPTTTTRYLSIDIEAVRTRIDKANMYSLAQ